MIIPSHTRVLLEIFDIPIYVHHETGNSEHIDWVSPVTMNIYSDLNKWTLFDTKGNKLKWKVVRSTLMIDNER